MILFLIRFIHLILIITIIFSIFIDNNKIKEFTLYILLILLLQYITNYGKCTLTQLEYLIMQENYKNGFLYRLINPVINIDEKYFDNSYYIIHVLLIIILIYQLK
jgi:hypothetical protein